MHQMFAFYLADHLRVMNTFAVGNKWPPCQPFHVLWKTLAIEEKNNHWLDSLWHWKNDHCGRCGLRWDLGPCHSQHLASLFLSPVLADGAGEHVQSLLSQQTWNKNFHVLHNHKRKRKIFAVMRGTSKCKAHLALKKEMQESTSSAWGLGNCSRANLPFQSQMWNG